MKKPTREVEREQAAEEINATLAGADVCVVAGGSRGPYTVIADRLGREDVDRVVAAVLGATGREVRREGNGHG